MCTESRLAHSKKVVYVSEYIHAYCLSSSQQSRTSVNGLDLSFIVLYCYSGRHYSSFHSDAWLCDRALRRLLD